MESSRAGNSFKDPDIEGEGAGPQLEAWRPWFLPTCGNGFKHEWGRSRQEGSTSR